MTHTRTLVLIPARMASTRLPDKPLLDITGLPMIVHVLRQAEAAQIGRVAVATDAPQIAAAVTAHGGEAVMTRADHPSGSDRIYEALCKLDPGSQIEAVVNVQGDLPTIPAHDIRAALMLLEDSRVDIGTLVAEIRKEEEHTTPSVVKLVGSLWATKGSGPCISPVPPRLTATARATITSGSTPIGGRRWSASSSCPRPFWNSARSSNNSGRWKPE